MARPKKLQAYVVDAVAALLSDAGREILADVVRTKLREQGLDADQFPVDDLTDHILAGKDDDFVWVDGPSKAQDQVVSLRITADDACELSSKLDALRSESKMILQECLDDAAKALLRTLERGYPEQRAHQDADLFGFRKRLELRWGVPLNLFRLMLTMSRETFDLEAESLGRSRAKSGLILREALLGIQARVLRTATAIAVLLENGLADDAYARWRTLYELSVIAFFVSEHGEEAANRYLLHEAVALKQRLDNEISWGAKFPKRLQREVEEDYHAVISEYGEGFARSYGWAAGFLGASRNPKFVHLEEAVRGNMTSPPYKESSFQVHGGRVGLLGLGSSGDQAAIGHSNLGLEVPLAHSSIALMQVTTLGLRHSPSRDLVLLNTILHLDDRIAKECRKVARQLDREMAEEEATVKMGG